VRFTYQSISVRQTSAARWIYLLAFQISFRSADGFVPEGLDIVLVAGRLACFLYQSSDRVSCKLL
jgi:hypothetical protein